jgi:hypothetical protein
MSTTINTDKGWACLKKEEFTLQNWQKKKEDNLSLGESSKAPLSLSLPPKS